MLVFKDFTCRNCGKEFSLYAVIANFLLKRNKQIKSRCPYCDTIMYFTYSDKTIVLDDFDVNNVQPIPYCETAMVC